METTIKQTRPIEQRIFINRLRHQVENAVIIEETIDDNTMTVSNRSNGMMTSNDVNLIQDEKKKPFIEANSREVSFKHLKHDCIVPVFAKDNEVTISHGNFIETVWEAATKVFPGEKIEKPEIRVSHLIKGRTPEATHKTVNELSDTDKTLYYERAAFVFEIPTISEDINGNRLNLSIGGVRAYNHENLYSRKIHEKFNVFVGFKNMVCCNMCISTDGLKQEMKVMSCDELLNKTIQLLSEYNIDRHLKLMKDFNIYSLTEHQFAQLAGKARLYQCLPPKQQKSLPDFQFTDSHLNIIARNYYRDDSFCRNVDGTINLWNVYNLFTSANKNSYIDCFLSRANNATDLMCGISEALNGSNGYGWFIN